ncbi:MAG: hypothetical protein ACXVBY_21410, partial [Isosphaeraceae bacterium]
GASPSLDGLWPRSSPGVRLAWEGDFEGLHSLALVNRALCRALLERGHGLGLVSGSAREGTVTPERVPLDPLLAVRQGGCGGSEATPR